MDKRYLIVIVFVIFGAVAGLFYQQDSNMQPYNPVNPEEQALKAGSKARIAQKAPDFTLKSLDGQEYTLSQLQGKVVILNMWATWCPPCKEEMPDLQKFYEENQGEDLIFLALNIGEDKETVAKFIQENKYTFPVLLDNPRYVSTELYPITGVPTTFFIDKDGVLRDIKIGAMAYEEVAERARNLLN